MGYGFHTGFVMNTGFGMNTGFADMQAMASIIFAIIISVFVIVAVKGLGEWNKNNNSPRLTVPASIVTKRTNVSRHRHDNHHHTTMTYYVTFQVDSGDRMEFRVDGAEYGLLVEGDMGELTFQGTRYLGFERR